VGDASTQTPGTQTDDASTRRAGERRFDVSVVREYRDGRIVIKWEPAFCIHTGRCFTGLPDVFDPGRRPWVDISAAAADDIARVVRACPTGALHYERLDGADQEHALEIPTVIEVENGPLYVHGAVKIVDENGEVVREDTRVALCRCGGSANKPFCDGTHRAIKFRTRPASSD
jgi:uncharacterized Fe-S cluster protein YjdI/CDGSH-type Zn-finger protein